MGCFHTRAPAYSALAENTANSIQFLGLLEQGCEPPPFLLKKRPALTKGSLPIVVGHPSLDISPQYQERVEQDVQGQGVNYSFQSKACCLEGRIGFAQPVTHKPKICFITVIICRVWAAGTTLRPLSPIHLDDQPTIASCEHARPNNCHENIRVSPCLYRHGPVAVRLHLGSRARSRWQAWQMLL